MKTVVDGMPELKDGVVTFENVQATIIKPNGQREIVFLNGRSDDIQENYWKHLTIEKEGIQTK